MAYWLTESPRHLTPRQFQCDFLSDIGKLPTSKKIGTKQPNDTISDNPCVPGSECTCYEDGSVWLLGMETDTWIKVGYRYGGTSNGGNTGGTGGINITSYNQLNDVPIENINENTSTPLILANLQSGIYKVCGSYSVTSGSKTFAAGNSGNIFVIDGNKIIDISSDGITLFNINPDNTYTSDTYSTASDINAEILKQMNTDDFNEKIENQINEKLSYITDNDIEFLFQ